MGTPDDDDLEDDGWEVKKLEVTAAVEDAMTRYAVWKMYADPHTGPKRSARGLRNGLTGWRSGGPPE
ncbi:hypothetical protein [Gordonia westfalica]|uniref:Uncharacterized protein n=1 Tax=Gordonia westfalica TaxID=158898 RepID=A0A1H2DQ11_9ACTN|nr:hypothetical protein [Gordonia westfalica]SDT84982.1 hypothetical protein SAMN04488548_1143 [Gordonia westfalica]